MKKIPNLEIETPPGSSGECAVSKNLRWLSGWKCSSIKSCRNPGGALQCQRQKGWDKNFFVQDSAMGRDGLEKQRVQNLHPLQCVWYSFGCS